MKLFFDFFPILFFFIFYKIFDIYYATVFAMVAAVSQVIFYRFKMKRYDIMHFAGLLIIFILGGATLFFHNPWFIKWKPTVLYWIMSLIFLFSPWLTSKPLIQRMLEKNANIKLPEITWYYLNYVWTLFFMFMGGSNLYVAYFYSTDTWVNFKLFGGMGLTLLFILLQSIYLTKYIIVEQGDNKGHS